MYTDNTEYASLSLNLGFKSKLRIILEFGFFSWKYQIQILNTQKSNVNWNYMRGFVNVFYLHEIFSSFREFVIPKLEPNSFMLTI